MKKSQKNLVTINDLSAVVTGLLLAMNLPASAPVWVAIVGSAFAIIFAKQLFGGLGQNFINPALAGRAFLLASYPTEMTTWVVPNGLAADAATYATPLAQLKNGTLDASLGQLVLGQVGGTIGETCAIALIIGGIYLLYKHVISWKIPVIYIATVFILFAVIGRHGMRMPLQEIFAGGVMLGGIFMATDYASSPVTPKGQVIFAVGAGLLTYLIRTFGGYPEGVSYSILIMNCCVPLIERFTGPRIFGARPEQRRRNEAWTVRAMVVLPAIVLLLISAFAAGITWSCCIRSNTLLLLLQFRLKRSADMKVCRQVCTRRRSSFEAAGY